MIVFLNEDRSYLNWVTHNRQGYVLDGRRRPKVRQLVLHRATCAEVKGSFKSRTHWTTAGRLKACALSLEELKVWAAEETDLAAVVCDNCRPGEENLSEESSSPHLTKLAAEVLDYVVEAAVIHLDNEHPPYRLCVGDIAACFAKTPGQLSAALHQLVDMGLTVMHGRMAKDAPFGPKVLVFPTPDALRTLDAFREESDAALVAELEKLHPA